MKKILIATHGKTAGGIVSTISMFLPATQIIAINAYVDQADENYDGDVLAFLDSLQAEDEGFIFTDIYGGSVNRRIVDILLRNQGQRQVKLIANCNVPMIIEIMTRKETLSDEEITAIIEMTKPTLIIPESIETDDALSDDAFFE